MPSFKIFLYLDKFSLNIDSSYWDSISEIVKPKGFKSELKIIYQTIENLNKACPNHLGDWYFTGEYPTFGGNKVANRAFMNYCDGIKSRAYWFIKRNSLHIHMFYLR